MASVPTDLRSALRHNPSRGRTESRGRAARVLKPPRLTQVEFIQRVFDVGHV
jgi:hypothetical protein